MPTQARLCLVYGGNGPPLQYHCNIVAYLPPNEPLPLCYHALVSLTSQQHDTRSPQCACDPV